MASSSLGRESWDLQAGEILKATAEQLQALHIKEQSVPMGQSVNSDLVLEFYKLYSKLKTDYRKFKDKQVSAIDLATLVNLQANLFILCPRAAAFIFPDQNPYNPFIPQSGLILCSNSIFHALESKRPEDKALKNDLLINTLTQFAYFMAQTKHMDTLKNLAKTPDLLLLKKRVGDCLAALEVSDKLSQKNIQDLKEQAQPLLDSLDQAQYAHNNRFPYFFFKKPLISFGSALGLGLGLGLRWAFALEEDLLSMVILPLLVAETGFNFGKVMDDTFGASKPQFKI